MKPVLILLLALSLSGCAPRATIHPGAANQIDSNFYDTLFVTNNVIESTKLDLSANKFPPSITPNIVTALNKLVSLYNLADQEYKLYHASALAGTATPAQQQALQFKINDVSTAVTVLASAKGGS